jgi:predicted nucleotidyltransferase
MIDGESSMRPSQALDLNRIAVRKIVERHHARNARVFGSVIQGEDTEHSDLDLLVDPTPETTLMDIVAIQVETEELLGIQVDVVTPKSLPAKFRERVLSEAVSV